MAPRASWRLDHHGVHDVEVELRPSTSVGELASALVDHVESLLAGQPAQQRSQQGRCVLTIESDMGALDPHELAQDSVPPSGSTIRLVEASKSDDPGARGSAAPVTLSTAGAKTALHYGRNAVAESVQILVGTGVVVTDEGTDLLYVDGALVRGHAGLRDGSLLRCGEWKATLRIHASLNPPKPGGSSSRIPIARGEWSDHTPAPVEVPAAPDRYDPPGFPWLTAMVPLLMAMGMWIATRSLMMVGFMAFSFVYVIASGIEARREARRADDKRVADFREELAEVDEELVERLQSQELRDEMHHPAAAEATEWVRPLSHRLWERSGSHPHPLSVRIGSADLPPDDPAMGRSAGRPGLRDEVSVVLEHNDPRRRPLTVELEDTGGLAIIGDHHSVTALGSAVLAQLAMLTPPDRLHLELAVPAVQWHWALWLPHRSPGASHTLTVFQRFEGEHPPIGENPVLWMAPDTVGLPDSVRALVKIDGAGRATFQLDNSPRLPFEVESHSPSALESAVRRIAGLESGATGSGSSLPESVSLAEVGTVFRGDLLAKRWAETPERGIAVPLGRMAGGGVLTLDLVADGPHALIGGTTGSGKSELLRSMLASIAANHSPQRVNLLLVDYKGGAAFGPLAELPHCVGLVTDLGAAEVVRTLTALRAELHRRERILDAHDAGDLHDLDEGIRPPSLLLVVDEFATLLNEVPDFLDGVLDVAQRGRSLGIHMILATQRPTGVVSDAVKANTSLRIALRLPDADDSTDIVNSAAASELPRHIPGRALVRLGHDILLTTQIAYSGGPIRPETVVDVRPLGSAVRAGDSVSDAPSELASLVQGAQQACELLGIPAPRRPLPPPLPDCLPIAELLARGDLEGAQSPVDPLPIGLLDRPKEQAQIPLMVDPMATGGLLVVGGPRSGASSVLACLAASADQRGGWDVHAIDTDGGLGDLAGLRSLQTFVRADDHEAVRRLLDGLLRDRSEHPTMLLVDGFASFEEQQAPVNRGKATDLVVRLASEGRARNVVVAVSARQRTQMPFALVNALGERIVLRSVDADQASMMDAPKELAQRSLPSGRGWVRGDWVQIAKPAASAKVELPEPARLPFDLSLDRLGALARSGSATRGDAASSNEDGLMLAVGVGALDLRIEMMDLTAAHGIIAGPPRSGRTTSLRTIKHAAERVGTTCFEDPDPARTLRDLIAHGSASQPDPAIGFVDNFDDFAEDMAIDALVCEIVRLGRKLRLRLVVSTDAQRMQRCFTDGANRLRGSRTGLLLGPDGHERAELLHQELHPRGDIVPAAGRGWLVDAHGCRIVQVAH